MILYYSLKILSKIICFFPYRFVIALGKGAGKLYYVIAKKQRLRAEATIMERLGYSDAEAKKTIHKLCKNLGMTVMEILYLPVLNKDNIRKYARIEGEEILWEALQKYHGSVLLGCHMDNWEWLGAVVSLHGFPLTAPQKQQPNKMYSVFMNELRRGAGIEIFTRGTAEVFGCARALKKGRILGLIADQDGGYDGIFVPFFGKMASSPIGPAYFSRKFKVPVIPIFSIRNEDGLGHQVIIEKPIEYVDTGDQKADDYNLTLAYTQKVEEIIKKYPAEWIWFQHRWNTPYGVAKEESK